MLSSSPEISIFGRKTDQTDTRFAVFRLRALHERRHHYMNCRRIRLLCYAGSFQIDQRWLRLSTKAHRDIKGLRQFYNTTQSRVEVVITECFVKSGKSGLPSAMTRRHPIHFELIV